MGNKSTAPENITSSSNNKVSSNAIKWLNCFKVKSNIRTNISSSNNNSVKFPSDVLKWMKSNAKPRMALKSMQVCKFFQHQKFPYFVVKDISYNECGWRYNTINGDRVDDIPTLNIFLDNSLWIIGSISLNHKLDSFSSFVSKIAVCEIQKLNLEYQNITFDELKILSDCGTIEEVDFVDTNITDGEIAVLFEQVLLCLLNATKLTFEKIAPSFHSSRVAAAVKMPKLKYFELNIILENFNLETFEVFQNAHPGVHFDIRQYIEKPFLFSRYEITREMPDSYHYCGGHSCCNNSSHCGIGNICRKRGRGIFL